MEFSIHIDGVCSFRKKMPCRIASWGTCRARGKQYTVAHPGGSASLTSMYRRTKKAILHRFLLVVSKPVKSHWAIVYHSKIKSLTSASKWAYLILPIYLLTNLAAALHCKLQKPKGLNSLWLTEHKVTMVENCRINQSLYTQIYNFKNSICKNNAWGSQQYLLGF